MASLQMAGDFLLQLPRYSEYSKCPYGVLRIKVRRHSSDFGVKPGDQFVSPAATERQAGVAAYDHGESKDIGVCKSCQERPYISTPDVSFGVVAASIIINPLSSKLQI